MTPFTRVNLFVFFFLIRQLFYISLCSQWADIVGAKEREREKERDIYIILFNCLYSLQAIVLIKE